MVETDVKSNEAVASIIIEKYPNGSIGVSSVNDKKEPLSFNEQRELLHRVIDTVNDNIMAHFVQGFVDRAVMQSKVKFPGFNGKSLKEFLVR